MRLRLATVLAAAVLLAGCAVFFDPTTLPPGTPAATLTERLGPPTGEFALPDGGRRLEFARGPFGKQTWMADVDARGSLVVVNQVLVEKRFNLIRAGMTREEVRLAIGRPSETSVLTWQPQDVWSYRYDSPFCQWFQVGISPQGRVIDTGYYPDPLCDDKEITMLFRHRR